MMVVAVAQAIHTAGKRTSDGPRTEVSAEPGLLTQPYDIRLLSHQHVQRDSDKASSVKLVQRRRYQYKPSWHVIRKYYIHSN